MNCWLKTVACVAAVLTITSTIAIPTYPSHADQPDAFVMRRYYRGVYLGLSNPERARETFKTAKTLDDRSVFMRGLRDGVRFEQGRGLNDAKAAKLAGVLTGMGLDVSTTPLADHVDASSPVFLKGIETGHQLDLQQHRGPILNPRGGAINPGQQNDSGQQGDSGHTTLPGHPTRPGQQTTPGTQTTTDASGTTITTTGPDGQQVVTHIGPTGALSTHRPGRDLRPNPSTTVPSGNTADNTTTPATETGSNATTTEGGVGVVPPQRPDSLNPQPADNTNDNGGNNGGNNGGLTQADLDAAYERGRRAERERYEDDRNKVDGWERFNAGTQCAENAAYAYLYGSEAFSPSDTAETGFTIGRAVDGLATASSGLNAIQNCGAMITGKYPFDRTGTFGRMLSAGNSLVRLASVWKMIQARNDARDAKKRAEEERAAREATKGLPEGTIVYDSNGVPGRVGSDGVVRPVISQPIPTRKGTGGGGGVTYTGGQPQTAIENATGQVVPIAKPFKVPGGPVLGGEVATDTQVVPTVDPASAGTETAAVVVRDKPAPVANPDGTVSEAPSGDAAEPKTATDEADRAVRMVKVLCDDRYLNCMWKQELSEDEQTVFEKTVAEHTADGVPANLKAAYQAAVEGYPGTAAPTWWLNMVSTQLMSAEESGKLPKNPFAAAAFGEELASQAKVRIANYTQGCLNEYEEYIARTGEEATADGQRQFFQEACFTQGAVEAVVNSGMTPAAAMTFGFDTAKNNLGDTVNRAITRRARDEADRATHAADDASASATLAAQSAQDAKNSADRAKTLADQVAESEKRINELAGRLAETEARLQEALQAEATAREDANKKAAEQLAALDARAGEIREQQQIHEGRMVALTELNAEMMNIGNLPTGTAEEIKARNARAQAFNEKAEALGIDTRVDILDESAPVDTSAAPADATVQPADTTAQPDTTVQPDNTVGESAGPIEAPPTVEQGHTEDAV